MTLGFSFLAAALLALATPQPGTRLTKPPGPPPSPMLHLYRQFADGGAQEVLADAIVSRRGVVALRATLRKEAWDFARGAYPDPDGKTPAVAKLRAESGRIKVRYNDLPRGGEIRFTTTDPGLVVALHVWMASTVRVNQKLHRDGGPGQDSG